MRHTLGTPISVSLEALRVQCLTGPLGGWGGPFSVSGPWTGAPGPQLPPREWGSAWAPTTSLGSPMLSTAPLGPLSPPPPREGDKLKPTR